MNGLSEEGLDDRPSGFRVTFHAAVRLLKADFRKSLILSLGPTTLKPVRTSDRQQEDGDDRDVGDSDAR